MQEKQLYWGGLLIYHITDGIDVILQTRPLRIEYFLNIIRALVPDVSLQNITHSIFVTFFVTWRKKFHVVAIHTPGPDHWGWVWLMVYACSTVFTHILQDHLCEIITIIHDALNMWSLRHHTVSVLPSGILSSNAPNCTCIGLFTINTYCYSLSVLCMQEEHTRMHVNQPVSFNNAPNLVKVGNLECSDTKNPQDMSIPTNPSKFDGVSTYSSDYAGSLLPGPMIVHRVSGDNTKVWHV